MLDLGKHAVFIWASYGIVALVVAGLIVWLVVQGRSFRRQLERLEAQGVTRRSRRKGGSA